MNEDGELHLSPAEEAHFDHLVDEGVMTPADARHEILETRRQAAQKIGTHVVTNSVTIPVFEGPARRTSRRGGRAYPERHDWDESPIPHQPMNEQQARDFETGIATLLAMSEDNNRERDLKRGLSENHVAALARARREKRERELRS